MYRVIYVRTYHCVCAAVCSFGLLMYAVCAHAMCMMYVIDALFYRHIDRIGIRDN